MKDILKSMNKEIVLNDDELYTIRQVAIFLNLTPYSVRKYVREGKIKGFKYNDYNVRIKGSDLRDYIKGLELRVPTKAPTIKEPESKEEFADLVLSFIKIINKNCNELNIKSNELEKIIDTQEKYNKSLEIKSLCNKNIEYSDIFLNLITTILNYIDNSDKTKELDNFIDKLNHNKEYSDKQLKEIEAFISAYEKSLDS